MCDQGSLLVFCALIFTVVQPLSAGPEGRSSEARGHRFFALKPDPGRRKRSTWKGRDDRRAFLEPGMEGSPH